MSRLKFLAATAILVSVVAIPTAQAEHLCEDGPNYPPGCALDGHIPTDLQVTPTPGEQVINDPGAQATPDPGPVAVAPTTFGNTGSDATLGLLMALMALLVAGGYLAWRHRES
jgi:LPXTG-motif cell wall-anchored protein